MARYTVTVQELGEGRKAHTTRIRAGGYYDARGRGISKMFGPNTFWWQDDGLGRDYGQVFERLNRVTSTSRTVRARLDITEGWGNHNEDA